MKGLAPSQKSLIHFLSLKISLGIPKNEFGCIFTHFTGRKHGQSLEALRHDTDFTVQSRNKAYKNSGKLFKNHGQTKGEGRSHHRLPLNTPLTTVHIENIVAFAARRLTET